MEPMEDAEDYAAFEQAVAADYDAEPLLSGNWCCGSQACYGGCGGQP
jgi:hypothetical protein